MSMALSYGSGSLQRWIRRVSGPGQMRALLPFLYGAGSRVAFAIVPARLIRAESAQKRAAWNSKRGQFT